MAIDAIGSVLTTGASDRLSNTMLDQQDFIKLFLAELNFQDPLEPVDNKEFLAQMAQFASIEQSRQASENMQNLVHLSSLDQSVGLLGKTVQAATSTGVLSGDVIAIDFQRDGASLTLELQDGSFITGVKMSQINLVQP
jgi:flagellar basal-body rod modification protein FlgD